MKIPALFLLYAAMTPIAHAETAPAASPPRAFWQAPSAAALFAAGEHYAVTLLSPAQRKLEHDDYDDQPPAPPRLVRYPVPEFDAMKAVLAKGIVAPAGAKPTLVPCAALSAKDHPGQPGETDWRSTPLQCRLPGMTLRLPAVRPSLFKSETELAPGSAGIEALSAQFGIVERGKVLGGPKWERDYDHMRYTGAWDIGTYELKLDKPVVEHVIGRTGLVGAYRWTPQERITPDGPSEGCAEGMTAQRRGKQGLPGYPAVKDGLMWFYAPQALAFRTAAVRTHVERGPKPVTNEPDTIRRVTAYEIDLDRDGIPDFVEWDIWGMPEINGTEPILAKREVYVNIGGAWYTFDLDYYAECT